MSDNKIIRMASLAALGLVVVGSIILVLESIRQSAWEEGYQEAWNKEFEVNLYNPNDFNCTVYGWDEKGHIIGSYSIKLTADEGFLISHPHIRIDFMNLSTSATGIDCGQITPATSIRFSAHTLNWSNYIGKRWRSLP